jgi:subfamily B ATP-binding cassette protein MsbA
MSDSQNTTVSCRKNIDALLDVARFNPKFTILIGLGLVAAVLEGISLRFTIPIVEIVQAEDPVAQADGLMAAFVTITLGIPFTLRLVAVGVAVVMTARYSMSFIVA